jgi:hypothetical protein
MMAPGPRIMSPMRHVVPLCASSLFLFAADESTSPIAFRPHVGKIATFLCSSTLALDSRIWGTDVYSGRISGLYRRLACRRWSNPEHWVR